MVMHMREVIVARGHENIRATHRTTLEVTKDRELSLRGDCIVGVDADKSISELSSGLKERLKEGLKCKITLELPDYGLKEELFGFGSEKLTFDHPTDIVVRKSSFVCGRTLLVKANKAARDLSREFVSHLRYPETEIFFIIEIE
ncbi:DUF371 domain-containing protein [Archaeoglobus sulfaticallidus]|nr:DUF371 domain-containing protein [Archaeoglobus sulfaticallidus]